MHSEFIRNFVVEPSAFHYTCFESNFEVAFSKGKVNYIFL